MNFFRYTHNIYKTKLFIWDIVFNRSTVSNRIVIWKFHFKISILNYNNTLICNKEWNLYETYTKFFVHIFSNVELLKFNWQMGYYKIFCFFVTYIIVIEVNSSKIFQVSRIKLKWDDWSFVVCLGTKKLDSSMQIGVYVNIYQFCCQIEFIFSVNRISCFLFILIDIINVIKIFITLCLLKCLISSYFHEININFLRNNMILA